MPKIMRKTAKEISEANGKAIRTITETAKKSEPGFDKIVSAICKKYNANEKTVRKIAGW